MYKTVPSAVPGLVRWTESAARVAVLSPTLLTASARVTFARPKSRTFAWPREVTKIFAGLMSR